MQLPLLSVETTVAGPTLCKVKSYIVTVLRENRGSQFTPKHSAFARTLIGSALSLLERKIGVYTRNGSSLNSERKYTKPYSMRAIAWHIPLPPRPLKPQLEPRLALTFPQCGWNTTQLARVALSSWGSIPSVTSPSTRHPQRQQSLKTTRRNNGGRVHCFLWCPGWTLASASSIWGEHPELPFQHKNTCQKS